MSTSIKHTKAAKDEQCSMGNQHDIRPVLRTAPKGMRLAPTLLLLSLILVAFSQPPVVSAAPACASACVLACNAKARICSRYPAGKLPRGYRAQDGIPPGYKFTKGNSACDSKMCSQKNKSICSLSPIGKSETSSDR